MGTITSQINTKFINVGPSIIPSSPFLSTTSSKNEQIGKKKIYKKCIYCDGSGTKYDIKYFLGIDGISLLLIVLTAFLTPICLAISVN